MKNNSECTEVADKPMFVVLQWTVWLHGILINNFKKAGVCKHSFDVGKPLKPQVCTSFNK